MGTTGRAIVNFLVVKSSGNYLTKNLGETKMLEEAVGFFTDEEMTDFISGNHLKPENYAWKTIDFAK